MTVVWQNGGWTDRLPTLELDDYGVLQGAIVVERMRTFRGRLHFLTKHVERFLAGCQVLGIQWPSNWQPGAIATELANKSTQQKRSDISVVMLATPGKGGDSPPTLILHDAPLPLERLQVWYALGQKLYRTQHSVVPSTSWPPHVKNRSRLNYFLADQIAQQRASAAGQRFAGALLSDASGNLQDTSTANLLLVLGNRLFAAPPASLLHGISIQTTLRLAVEHGFEVCYETLTKELLLESEEAILTGSTGCIWTCQSIDEKRFPGPSGATAQRLTAAWREEIGFDFTAPTLKSPSNINRIE